MWRNGRVQPAENPQATSSQIAFVCSCRRTGLTPKRLALQDFDAIASVGL